jgi:aspartyl-tRNA(Asn)/glutamyl-tRNA(Gln) amidotransferase subunit C
MSLTLKEVEHIAELARLDLSETEKEQYREQLSAILDYAASLQDLDTAGIPPTASVLPERSVLRNDEVGACLDTEELMKNAPRKSGGQFQVPAVME